MEKNTENKSIQISSSLPTVIFSMILILLKLTNICDYSWFVPFLLPIGVSIFWTITNSILSIGFILIWTLFQTLIGNNKYNKYNF